MGITGKIYGINGPVITIQGNPGYKMNEMVYVGEHRLVGEVIRLSKEKTTIQVYEETSGLKPGEEVAGAGCAISVKLAPGILNNIFDGIERPLQKIAEKSGAFIPTGAQADALDREKLWETHITVQEGDEVAGGSIIAEVPETKSIVHRVMLPPGVSGTVTAVKPDGDYTICDEIVTIRTADGGTKALTMTQEWPIRKPRPVKDRYPADRPLVTGQRILDTLFPIAKGGTAALPGGFGTGKTMTQHQLAKWCDADIIIYIGCGERGNEMTNVLEEFGELNDPKTGNLLMDRTTLIANTSNMPVAAREASIYTGITLAEYYRDMGYHVAIMADSTSRWAEALRELSGRLEEMPAEEGFTYTPLFCSDTIVPELNDRQRENRSYAAWNEMESVDIDAGRLICNPAAGEVAKEYCTVAALSRKVGDKEQRIIVSGDADCLGNEEVTLMRGGNYFFGLAALHYLTNNEMPFDVRRPEAKDVRCHLTMKQYGWINRIFTKFLPLLLLGFAVTIWLRRRSH